MTEEQKKEMLNGIINNGEKWEGRKRKESRSFGKYLYGNWQPYKLGDEIHDDWEYRKCKEWFVFEVKENEYLVVDYKISVCKYPFEGSKEECEKWIEENTKKTWFEDFIYNNFGENAEFYVRICATEVCKKILEEYEKFGEPIGFIKGLIEDLGIKIK